ncbi:CD1871A family CXXC motif-containing protein [uncultured Anaerococcus sp.]|nr:CD1871A family CXXC motif-containing protein [uncultured Anaerococcus sp.]
MIFEKRRNVGRLLLLISVAFIIYGVMRGEMDTVFAKAVKLCLECIGIG